MVDRILRLPEVAELLGVSKPTINRWFYAGEFPAPMKIGPRANGWKESTIQRWIDSRQKAESAGEPVGA